MIARLLGHAEVQTMAHYAHLSHEALNAAATRIADSIGEDILRGGAGTGAERHGCERGGLAASSVRPAAALVAPPRAAGTGRAAARLEAAACGRHRQLAPERSRYRPCTGRPNAVRDQIVGGPADLLDRFLRQIRDQPIFVSFRFPSDLRSSTKANVSRAQ